MCVCVCAKTFLVNSSVTRSLHRPFALTDKGFRKMYSDGHEVDGSWVLRVYVTDLQVERSLRVKGELHIGGVMLRLVEDLGMYDTRLPSFSTSDFFLLSSLCLLPSSCLEVFAREPRVLAL